MSVLIVGINCADCADCDFIKYPKTGHQCEAACEREATVAIQEQGAPTLTYVCDSHMLEFI